MDTIIFEYDPAYEAEVKALSILAGVACAVWSLALSIMITMVF